MPTLSVIIPVYGNEGSIVQLLQRLEMLNDELTVELEAVFVIDGSPDRSLELLRENLPAQSYKSQLITHSRNFGSFPAVSTGLRCATGRWFAVIAADLQEPPEMLRLFLEPLESDRADVVFGRRVQRMDDRSSKVSSGVFWWFYRKLVQREVPPGGIDVFACNERFRRELMALEETNSSLVGLAIWLGFRRCEVPYVRQRRVHGKSAWTLSKKFRYLTNSVFSFTDLPIRICSATGLVGVVTSSIAGLVIVVAKLTGGIAVPGYAAIILAICFFGTLNLFALGVIGAYLWRTFELSKRRPSAVVMDAESFAGAESTSLGGQTLTQVVSTA